MFAGQRTTCWTQFSPFTLELRNWAQTILSTKPRNVLFVLFLQASLFKGRASNAGLGLSLKFPLPCDSSSSFVSVHTFTSDTRSRVLQMLPHSESARLLLYWGRQCFPFFFIPCKVGRQEAGLTKEREQVCAPPFSSLQVCIWNLTKARQALCYGRTWEVTFCILKQGLL